VWKCARVYVCVYFVMDRLVSADATLATAESVFVECVCMGCVGKGGWSLWSCLSLLGCVHACVCVCCVARTHTHSHTHAHTHTHTHTPTHTHTHTHAHAHTREFWYELVTYLSVSPTAVASRTLRRL